MLIACKDKYQIELTKKILVREFDVKQLGEVKKVIGITISRDRSKRLLILTHKSYLVKVLKTYAMNDCKVVKTPLASHFKLSDADLPTSTVDIEYMQKVPYANVVGSLMYLMVCTRPDTGYGLSDVSRFLANPDKNH